jgi:hypothetical protein
MPSLEKRGGPAYCLTLFAEPMRASFFVTSIEPLNSFALHVGLTEGFRSAKLMATSLQIAKLGLSPSDMYS